MKLSELIQEYYSTNNTLTAVVPGRHYAVLDPESKMWHRVKCLQVDDPNFATVLFIDRGDEDRFEISNFRPLTMEFCQLPAQSVGLSVCGFEQIENIELKESLEDLILEKDVFVQNMGVADSGKISVQLYIEEDEKEKNINGLLKEVVKTLVDPTVFIKVVSFSCLHIFLLNV